MERSTVSMRVAFVLRSAEVQLLFRRFVRDLSSVFRHSTRLVNSPPPPKHNQQPTPNPNKHYNKQTNNPPKHNYESSFIGRVLVVYNLLKEEYRTHVLYSSFFLSQSNFSPGLNPRISCDCMVCMILPGGGARLQT